MSLELMHNAIMYATIFMYMLLCSLWFENKRSNIHTCTSVQMMGLKSDKIRRRILQGYMMTLNSN